MKNLSLSIQCNDYVSWKLKVIKAIIFILNKINFNFKMFEKANKNKVSFNLNMKITID